jgi:hypothetical protein
LDYRSIRRSSAHRLTSGRRLPAFGLLGGRRCLSSFCLLLLDKLPHLLWDILLVKCVHEMIQLLV